MTRLPSSNRMKYSSRTRTATDPIGGQKWHDIHPRTACAGRHCVIHNPSQHSMSAFPRHLRETGLVERICPHGVGHPDPDSVAYFADSGLRDFNVHGCDGCCGDVRASSSAV